MTVSSTVTKIIANGNDAATVFSFSPVVIPDNTSQVVVTHVDSIGTETLLTEGSGSTNYSVQITSFPGTGTVTYPASGGTPLATGEKLIIERILTLDQQTDLENQGGYFPEVQELQYDRFTMQNQQQQDKLDRAVHFPTSSTVNGEINPITIAAGRYLKINSGGTGVEASELIAISAQPSNDTPSNVNTTAGSAGISNDYSRKDHVHFLDTLAVADGGTGATSASAARSNLGSGATGDAVFVASTEDAAGVALGLEGLNATGLVLPYIGTSAPTGWILFQGQSLGDTGSGATFTGAIYKDLYDLFWDSMADAQAPVSSGRGASSTADWNAGKTLTMPDPRGRTIIGTGTGSGLTARTHGDTAGSEDSTVATHSHTSGTLAANSGGAHVHNIEIWDLTGSGTPNVAGADSSGSSSTASSKALSSGSHGHSISGSTANAGSSGTDTNLGPWFALNWIIKL